MVKLTLAAALTTAAVAACTGPGDPAGSGTAGPTTAPPTSARDSARPLSQAGAEPVTPDPRVGALFLGDTTTHTCSGSVLASTTGDLILTAAHCLLDGVDAAFVPGFGEGGGDAWHVEAVYLDPRWIADQDPRADYAIVRVAGGNGAGLLAEAEGGLTLGSAPAPGSSVTVTGYQMGEGGGALACRGTATSSQGFPSLACGGLTDGFSGAPWVSGSTVTGLVGGLDGGGCDDDVSYSPVFDHRIARLLVRAEAGGPGDAAPEALASDC